MKKKIIVLGLIINSLFGLQISAQKSIITPKNTLNQIPEKSLRCMGLEKISDANNIPSYLTEELNIKDNKISLEFYPNSDIELLLEELKNLGLQKATIRGKNRVITGMLPLELVTAIDNCKHLYTAMPASIGTLNFGLTQNQAGSAVFADHISKKLGLTGKGVKIGIISDTFNVLNGLQQRVQNGDLPGKGNPNGFENDVVILRESDIPTNTAREEGRAMAELVHDIAPAAEIYFYGAIDGYFILNDAVNALVDAGCNIIVDDLGYDTSPLYQDGLVANTVNETVKDGVTYFSAAGNSSRNGFESPYNPAEINEIGEVLDDTYSYDSGRTERLMVIPANSSIRIALQWESESSLSPFVNDNDIPFVSTDLDIFLKDFITGNNLNSSRNFNLFTRLPFERLTYTNFSDEDIIASLEIKKGFLGDLPNRLAYFISATSDDFVIESVNGNDGSGTIYGHAAAEQAITVGAMQYTLSPEFEGTPIVEDFSSYGGLPKTLNLASEPMELVIPNKPDIIAPDGVNNTTFGSLGSSDLEGDGFRNFFGTSAAAPNAAAIAALMLEANPDLSPQDIKNVLIDTALDMDDAATVDQFDQGFDFASGFGLLQADKAIASVIDEPIVFRIEMIDANTRELINIIENNEEIDLSEIDSNIDLRILAANVGAINTTVSGSRTLISNNGNTFPYLAVNSNESFNRPWNALSGSYSLRWFATADISANKDSDIIDFTIINSNFDNNAFIGPLNISGVNLSIFPNPAVRNIPTQINLKGGTIVSYKIFNQVGTQLISENGNTLNTNQLNSGLYLLIAQDANGRSHSGKVSVL